MIGEGAAPTRSAFLSAFFTLVGTHGLHVTLGLAWLVAMMGQVATLGFRPIVVRRLLCFMPVLARPRHRLDRRVHHRLPGSALMADSYRTTDHAAQGQPPGIERSQRGSVLQLPRRGSPSRSC